MSITFSFAPTIIRLLCRYTKSSSSIECQGTGIGTTDYRVAVLKDLTTSFTTISYCQMMTTSSSDVHAKKSSDGKTFYWYGGSSYNGCSLIDSTTCYQAWSEEYAGGSGSATVYRYRCIEQ